MLQTTEVSTQPDRAVRIGRIGFVIGSVIFVVIGALHLLVQFTALSTAEVRAAYRAGGAIDLNGDAVDGWELFAGTSVLMGVLLIAVGVLDLVGLYSRPRTLGPPKGMAIVTMMVLVVIAIVGAVYLSPAQTIGGIVGLVLFGGPLFSPRRSAEVSPAACELNPASVAVR